MQSLEPACVVNHIIGHRQALFPAGLGSHDGQNLTVLQTTAVHHPLDLDLGRTVDYQDA
jgi:hypothetical protein